MSHGALAVGVEVLVELAEAETGAKSGLPGGRIHGEAIEVLEINHEATIVTTETKVAAAGGTVSMIF